MYGYIKIKLTKYSNILPLDSFESVLVLFEHYSEHPFTYIPVYMTDYLE